MSDDIVAFIRARLDEDEGTARIISAGGYAPQEWRDVTPKNAAGWHEIRAFDRTNIEPPEAAQDEGGVPVAVVPGGRLEHEHIARHDPARVLREVEAKRRTLERHASDGGVCSTCARSHMEEFYDSETEQETYEPVFTEVEYPCPTLCDMAYAWSDHPDYREEWRL